MSIRNFALGSILALAGFVLNSLAWAEEASQSAATHGIAPAKQKVVFQVSDGDAPRWNLALNNVKNVQDDLGKDRVEVEIVAYGWGSGMLKMDSVVGNRVGEAVAAGVRVVACKNTMKLQKLTRDDMLPALSYVPAGVVELMRRQREGYAYIRP